MADNLVIVESPAKAKTIKKYLGKDFEVLASYGHVRDLVPKEGAVDPDNGFAMKYQLLEKNQRHVDAIAVVWAGLELLAALPLARPFSDLPGPLLPIRPWLPVILPAAGFAVLWRQAPHWTQVAEVRTATEVLLVLTADWILLREHECELPSAGLSRPDGRVSGAAKPAATSFPAHLRRLR